MNLHVPPPVDAEILFDHRLYPPFMNKDTHESVGARQESRRRMKVYTYIHVQPQIGLLSAPILRVCTLDLVGTHVYHFKTCWALLQNRVPPS